MSRAVNSSCATARMMPSYPASRGLEQDEREMPYSCFTSSGSARGSHTSTVQPNSLSSRMISITFELRISGQFSLNVIPSTRTLLPEILAPSLISSFTNCEAMKAPMPSLMRRPARMISGW